ncbi:MAG TPA: SET domain-containing protein-lysine N-methyltransferase [Halioglobus sp.]
MIHPGSELRFISPDVGYGVFATEHIPRGTFLWVLDCFDRILTPKEVGALQPMLRNVVDKYAYQGADGDFVFCWDFGRYMNHSCEPTSRGVGDAFEVAIRDIEPGEELTCEYGTLNLVKPMTCYCGAPSCRGTIRRDDAEHHFELWDEQTTSAFALSHSVAQPLLPYAKLGPRDLPLVEALQEGRAAWVPSSRDFHIVDVPAEVLVAAGRGAR